VKTRSLLLIPILLSGSGTAARALSLHEAIDEGLRSHQLLAAATARVNAAEASRLQATRKPNPRLFLQAENARAWGRPGFVYPRDADSFLYLSQVVETGHKRTLRTDAAQASIQRSEAERAALRWQLAGRIAAAYWAAAGAAQYREAFRESLRNFDLTVQYHRDRVREGAMAEVDLLRMELESERLRAAFRVAEQDAVSARIRLFREMGQEDRPAESFPNSLENLPAVTAPDNWAATRPDLAALDEATRQAAAQIRVQQSLARPDPEVLGGYKRSNGFDTVIAGVQINLPFRNRNEGNIAAATAERAAAEATRRAAAKAAAAEVEAARTAYDARRELVTSTLPAVRARAREIARISAAAYREGGADLLRLLDAERGRIDADLQYVRALMEFQIAAVELQTALGVLR
jgi:cobalt-zinc-cadmium efflux system outer membrane protein